MVPETQRAAWKLAAARGKSYRRWSAATALITFCLALASIVNPQTEVLEQLMYAAFAGAIVGRIIAALYSARSEALREESKGEK